MFYILSKLFSFLCFPIAWIVALLVVAAFLKKKKQKKQLLFTSIIALLFFLNPLITNWVYHTWSHAMYQPLSDSEVFDCAIVAGGFSDFNPHTQQWDMNHSGDRMVETIRLYRKGKIKKILISGDAASNDLEGKSTKDGFMLVMHDLGVDTTDIWVEQKACNTRENALFSKDFLIKNPQANKLLLVTSGFHALRTKLCYDKVGLQTTLFATDIPNIERWSWRLIFPDWNTSLRWNELFHEWIGLLTYKIMGYI